MITENSSPLSYERAIKLSQLHVIQKETASFSEELISKQHKTTMPNKQTATWVMINRTQPPPCSSRIKVQESSLLFLVVKQHNPECSFNLVLTVEKESPFGHAEESLSTLCTNRTESPSVPCVVSAGSSSRMVSEASAFPGTDPKLF